MSWDVYIAIDTGGPNLATVEDVRNVTYNNGRLFGALHVHPDDLKDSLCSTWEKNIRKALSELIANPEKYREFEPPNKWGGIDDSIDFLTKLLAACMKHPKATVQWY